MTMIVVCIAVATAATGLAVVICSDLDDMVKPLVGGEGDRVRDGSGSGPDAADRPDGTEATVETSAAPPSDRAPDQEHRST